jgi:hypothetical protein
MLWSGHKGIIKNRDGALVEWVRELCPDPLLHATKTLGRLRLTFLLRAEASLQTSSGSYYEFFGIVAMRPHGLWACHSINGTFT